MLRRAVIKPKTYFDSVTLMRLSAEAQNLDGVGQVAAVVATQSNREVLLDAGFSVDLFDEAGPNDLVIAVEAESEEAVEAALARVDELLAGIGKGGGGREQVRVRTLDAALEEMPGINLALISVPGAFAAREAMRALQRGLHVMLFSDNVPLEKEIALKQEAAARGLLLMGPDCGTAIIGGVPLGFANVVRRGAVGMVTAAGTGLQEVACLIHRLGGGISHAIGTGGRDLTAEVGGMSMLQGIDLLEQDPDTGVITLVSKPPAAETMERLMERLAGVDKPCVVNFLGVDPSGFPDYDHITFVPTLEAAAAASLHALAGLDAAAGSGLGELPPADQEIGAALAAELARFRARGGGDGSGAAAPCPGGRKAGPYVRGLYCGGTLCQEALLTLGDLGGPLYSNITKDPERQLADPRKSRGHTVIDLGEDFFTENRPHPMIDVSYRIDRLKEEAADAKVGVILMDVVLGYGSHPDPAGPVAEAVTEIRARLSREGRHLALIASVTGTGEDPQVYDRQVATLREAGVTVMSTNHRAAVLAGRLIRELEGMNS